MRFGEKRSKQTYEKESSTCIILLATILSITTKSCKGNRIDIYKLRAVRRTLEMRLKLNIKKTKCLTVNKQRDVIDRLEYDRKPIL